MIENLQLKIALNYTPNRTSITLFDLRSPSIHTFNFFFSISWSFTFCWPSLAGIFKLCLTNIVDRFSPSSCLSYSTYMYVIFLSLSRCKYSINFVSDVTLTIYPRGNGNTIQTLCHYWIAERNITMIFNDYYQCSSTAISIDRLNTRY